GGLVVREARRLTPNGKLDGQALPAREPASATPWRAPRTAYEEILCALFGEVVGIGGVGIEGNFFGLGGDSISSMQLVARARKAGIIHSVREVLEHQSIEAMRAVACSVPATS